MSAHVPMVYQMAKTYIGAGFLSAVVAPFSPYMSCTPLGGRRLKLVGKY